MFDNMTIAELVTAANELNLDPAALMAVAEVESGGRALFEIDGHKEPAIRFEGHYFDRRLSGAQRDYARKAGLAAPIAGKIANPTQQALRWQLLDRAIAVSRKGALESTSWGLGQVMGAHWEWLGYRSVEELVAEARGNIAGQVRLMLRFIVKAGLIDNLKKHDWRGFALRYNGPAFAKNRYDVKMAAAYQRWSVRLISHQQAVA